MQIGEIIIVKNNLDRKKLKKFSISYNDAVRLGITNEDLKYISENNNKFRVSVPYSDGKRKTKVVYDLIDAIHLKYDYLKQIEEEELRNKNKEELINESKSNITKYSTVQEGLDVYIKERYADVQRNYIQLSTYEQDCLDAYKNKYLRESKIITEVIKDVDKKKATEFINYLHDLTNRDGNKLSENTIYKPYSFIRKLFNYFKDDLEIIDKNPFDNIKNKPQAVSNEKDYFNIEEMHYIHDKIEHENIRFRTLIILMLDCGLRKEEALAIKYKDINKLRKTIRISRAYVKSRLGSNSYIKDTKTKASIREIIISNHALELIERYKEFKISCGFVVTDDDFVFTAWDSMDLIDPDRYTAEFRKFLEKIDIQKKIPLKNLRTTNTTFFVAKNQNIKAIQKHQGHSSFDTTMKYYAQSDLLEDKKLVNEYEKEFYNKLGLSVCDLYKIVSNRFDDEGKLINVLEEICNVYIDDSNFVYQLERCQNYFRDLFPIFDKIIKIDSVLSDDDLKCLFEGYTSKYLSIKIEPLPPELKI